MLASQRKPPNGRRHQLLRICSVALIFLFPFSLAAQCVWVHFIHGSTPRAAYRGEEMRWRGGKWGGHVGIEVDSNEVLDFSPGSCRVPVWPHRRHPAGQFLWRSREGFWCYFGLPPDSLMRTSIRLPVIPAQQEQLRSIARQWSQHSPYDYAFFGMRCTSVSYDLLMRAGMLPHRSRLGVVVSNFYPRQLRKRLLLQAAREGWLVVQMPGSQRRIWSR